MIDARVGGERELPKCTGKLRRPCISIGWLGRGTPLWREICWDWRLRSAAERNCVLYSRHSEADEPGYVDGKRQNVRSGACNQFATSAGRRLWT